MEEVASPSLSVGQCAEAFCKEEGTSPAPKLAVLGRQKKCRNLLTLVVKERLEATSQGSTADSSPYLGP